MKEPYSIDTSKCVKCGACRMCMVEDEKGRLDAACSAQPWPGIVKDNGKCILCGDCVRMCNEVQNVGAIDFAHRGSNMCISTAFDVPLANSGCVGCGQCAAVCPTDAIVVKDDSEKIWKHLSDPNTKVTAQIAPAVRVAISRELGLNQSDAFGYIVATLHRVGFDEVFDTATGADLTVLEESHELLKRLDSGEQGYPLFTSCCPAWVNYLERYHPELLPHMSTCKSPMQMLAALVKEHNAVASSRKNIHVAVMIAVVSGLKNAETLIGRIKEGEHYDFVEVMACPGGCVSGAGQPYAPDTEKQERSKRLYASDKLMSVKRSEENPLITSLYSGLLKNRVHELLHVSYANGKEVE